ncbi:MAG TPA: acetylglutamate kinase [Candidatus Coproplasma excrementigallinarum]|mgnify:CR=1 FL=1|uniref:Acetylglutamate kinase n=1 Tax=Candidatus Coproplasma excrementigallinarum TaxID=2840747 RepID=A0A9D1SIH6_9FIRM|nr:acetylglutamate kinase [Candidatus Coproplasma excrementigallinarum]
MDKQEQAEFLIEALPYIKKYYNKIIVIKYGGNAMTDEKLKASVMNDVAVLNALGIFVVIVHGGGPDISDISKKMGIVPKFVNGLRYTDKDTAEIARMALAGKVNKSLVDMLCSAGGKAIGLCGEDGHMLRCEKLSDDLGFVGKIVNVNADIIKDVLSIGYVPVIAPIGFDGEGNVYNVNADTAAAAIAGAIGAESLILMTDIKGLMENKDDPESLIKKVYVSDIPALVKQGIISGGMIPKIECCKEAIRRGVNKVFITDGRVYHSILVEILSEEGSGTMFYS